MAEEAKKKPNNDYINDWKKKYQKAVNLHFSVREDADVLEFLDSVPNKTGYVRELIRADMRKKKKV